MVRSISLSSVVLAVALLSPSSARGDAGGTLGPDGTAFTKANYPTDLASRPLTLPAGMVTIGADLTHAFSSGSNPDNALGFALGYGVVRDLELNLSAVVLDGTNLNLGATAQFNGNMGARFVASYSFDSKNGITNTALSGTAGIPIKLKARDVPLSLTALESLVTISSLSSSADVSAPNSVTLSTSHLSLVLPLSVQCSPTPAVTLEGMGVYTRVSHLSTSADALDLAFLSVGGRLYVTLPHLDLVAGLTQSVVFFKGNSNSGTSAGFGARVLF